MRASVIVAVFDPGDGFDDLLASLDRQTLSPEEFEVILCDDGSASHTRERLAEVARARPNVRVLSLTHTGWPGTPRNAGIDAARGDYLYFVDQDDWLFDSALLALCDFADLNGSDVVVGREVGVGRDLSQRMFRRDIPRAVLGTDPLLELLTPHKLFRTEFLRAHGIRYPDGKVRLEDHLLVMRAYFAARTISILASVPCYAWVRTPDSLSSSRIDPETYFPHLEAVLDVVEANTEAGALRDTLLRHWLRAKILRRLTGERLENYPDGYLTRFLDMVVPIAQRHFGAGVRAGLPPMQRLRADALNEDRRDDIVRLGAFESGLECRVAVTSTRWSRGGGLSIETNVHVTHAGADALAADAQRERGLGHLAEALAALAAEDAGHIALTLDDGERRRRLAGGDLGDATPSTLRIDPLRVFPRGDRSTGGRVVARVRRAGWSFEVPVLVDRDVLSRVGASPFLAGRPLTLSADSEGALSLRRTWPRGGVRDAAGRVARRLRAALRLRARPRRGG